MSHPTHYRAARVVKTGEDLVIQDVAWKDPVQGEIMVKVLACGVCHSDAIAKFSMMGCQTPLTPGHEVVGTVVAVGPGEKRFKVNDYVGSGWHGGHCSNCKSCRKGDFVTCENGAINGITRDGGYAEYCILRTEAVCAIPEGMDPAEAAPLLCAGVTTFNSLRNMDLHAGDVVGVQGIGGLGHLALQYARQMGYTVVALSSGDSKKTLAHELGAHHYFDSSKVNQAEELQKLGGAKVILATAPHPEAIQSLIHGLAVNGQLVILAVGDDIKVPLGPMIMKRLRIQGWPSGTGQDSEETVAFAKVTGIKTRIEKFSLDNVNEAFAHMMDNKVRFRAVLVM